MEATPVAGIAPARPSYVCGLDLVRFACALLVTGCHLTAGGRTGDLALPAGWIGVQVFFVISGLVIAQSARTRRFAGFVENRFLRLYPTAWVCLAMCMILSLMLPERVDGLFSDWQASPRYIAGSLTLLNSRSVVSAFWTLKVEISFYAAVSCLILLRRIEWLDRLACLLAAASSLYLALLSAQYLDLFDGLDLWFGYGVGNMLLLRHGIYFAAGILLWSWREGRIRSAGRVTLLLCLAAAVPEIACRARESLADFHVDQWTLTGQALLIYSVAMLAIVLSLRFNHLVPDNERLISLTKRAGAVTYPLYLLHQGAGGALALLASRMGLAPPVGLGMGTIGALLLSDLFATRVEPPMKRLAQRLLAGARPAPSRLLQPA